MSGRPEDLGRVAPLWEDCRVPFNAYDARQRFKCAALDMMLDGNACARNSLTGERFTTTCTDCPAGKARVRLLDKRPRLAVVEDPPPAPPPPPPSVAPAVVEALQAQVAALTERVSKLETGLALAKATAEKAYAPRRGAHVSLDTRIGCKITEPLLTQVREWCKRHEWTISALVRAAVLVKLRLGGVKVNNCRVSTSRGMVEVPNANIAVQVPDSWAPHLEQMRRTRQLSRFVFDALAKYMEANP